MNRLRILAVASLAFILAGNSTRAGRPDESNSLKPYLTPQPESSSAVEATTCKIYSLNEMGYDADLGQWLAQTIPEVIAPGTWKENGVLPPNALRYYAPKNILVVRHFAAVQAEVDGFLKNMKTSLPKGKESSRAAAGKSPRGAAVVPVEYRAPALLRASAQVPDQSSYPVPAPIKTPKHLFHFLIRYEGEGIIDNNVVKFMKVQSHGGKKDKEAVASPLAGLGAGIGALAEPSLLAPEKKKSDEKKADKKDLGDEKP
jgi:hypothetical protein